MACSEESCLYLPILELQAGHYPQQAFTRDSGILNPGPHTWETGTYTIDLSLGISHLFSLSEIQIVSVILKI